MYADETASKQTVGWKKKHANEILKREIFLWKPKINQ
jgi:hypothetical protein